MKESLNLGGAAATQQTEAAPPAEAPAKAAETESEEEPDYGQAGRRFQSEDD